MGWRQRDDSLRGWDGARYSAKRNDDCPIFELYLFTSKEIRFRCLARHPLISIAPACDGRTAFAGRAHC